MDLHVYTMKRFTCCSLDELETAVNKFFSENRLNIISVQQYFTEGQYTMIFIYYGKPVQ